MNLKDLFLRLIDEQKWRESKAQGMSSGLGSMPYNFDETMNLKYPGFMNALTKQEEEEQKRQKLLESISRGLGQNPTTNFMDFYRQQEFIERRKKDLENKYKTQI